jgi:hypothetical protein
LIPFLTITPACKPSPFRISGRVQMQAPEHTAHLQGIGGASLCDAGKSYDRARCLRLSALYHSRRPPAKRIATPPHQFAQALPDVLLLVRIGRRGQLGPDLPKVARATKASDNRS